MNKLRCFTLSCIVSVSALLGGCATEQVLTASARASLTTDVNDYQYLIGPGDQLTIFVWRNPEISGSFTVRPDGKLSTSLVEDIPVSGRTPTMLARQLEEQLATYINNPRVTVSLTQFNGPFSEQVRVIGEAANPRALSYTQHMTLLDVMIQVGGLTEFANGNEAKLVRIVNDRQQTFNINIEDLIKDGEISKNVDILPGDVIIIPEAWF